MTEKPQNDPVLKLRAAVNEIYGGHQHLQDKVIPMLKSKREIAAEELATKKAIEEYRQRNERPMQNDATKDVEDC